MLNPFVTGAYATNRARHSTGHCTRQPGARPNRAQSTSTGRSTLPGAAAQSNRALGLTGHFILNRAFSTRAIAVNQPTGQTDQPAHDRWPEANGGWASLWVITPPSYELSQQRAAVTSWQGEDITRHFPEIHLKYFGDFLNTHHIFRTYFGDFNGSICPNHPEKHLKAGTSYKNHKEKCWKTLCCKTKVD